MNPPEPLKHPKETAYRVTHNVAKWNFNHEDAIQVVIGAFSLAIPIAFSEEAWNLSQSLPWLNIALLVGISWLFLGLFAYQSVFQSKIRHRRAAFILRIVFAYGITLAVVGLVLLALNKLPVVDDPLLALKRLIVIAMPASMGAIIVDSFDKE